VSSQPVFHPERLVAVLGRFKVSYVLTGDLAARLHGAPWTTSVAQVVPQQSNENRNVLATALKHLNARIYTVSQPDGVELEITPDALAAAGVHHLITSCGRLDVVAMPQDSGRFDELRTRAVEFDLHGDRLNVASLDDLVRLAGEDGSLSGRYKAAMLNELLQGP